MGMYEVEEVERWGAVDVMLKLDDDSVFCRGGRHLDKDDLATVKQLTRLLRRGRPPPLADLTRATCDLLRLLERLLSTAPKRHHDGAPCEGAGAGGAAPGCVRSRPLPAWW